MMGAKRKRIAKLEAQLDDASESFQRCSASLSGVRQDLGQCQEDNRSLRETAAALRDAKNLAISQRQDALDRVGQLIETRDRLMAERDRARESMAAMGQGILAIHGERLTHTSEHDFDADHDDVRTHHELAMAAAVYAAPETIFDLRRDDDAFTFESLWPWSNQVPKVSRPVPDLRNSTSHQDREARIHELVKAGSLIAAEIERVIRLGGSEVGSTPRGTRTRLCPVGRSGIEGPALMCDLMEGHQGPHSWDEHRAEWEDERRAEVIFEREKRGLAPLSEFALDIAVKGQPPGPDRDPQ